MLGRFSGDLRIVDWVEGFEGRDMRVEAAGRTARGGGRRFGGG